MPEVSAKKILFTDIDETLVTTDKHLTEENREAIEEFLSRGNIVAISTGRALSGASNLARDLGLYGRPNTYICAFNGGQIFDTYKEKTLFRKGLDRNQVRLAVSFAREYGIHIHAYPDREVISETDNDNLRKYCRLQKLPSKIVPDLADAIEGTTCKLLAIDFASPERVTEFRSLITDKVSDTMDIFNSNPWLLEIVPKGINKGNALRSLAEHLHVPIENTISAGDEENDIPMIRAAGVGCAMKNARQELKNAADYVTVNDNNHSGIAEILRKFG